jgi:hypothetical protein
MKRALPIVTTGAIVLALGAAPRAQVNQPWNNPGLAAVPSQQQAASSAPAPRRDLTGIWDAGGGGISGPGHVGPPFTPYGLELLKRIHPGNGPRMVPVNDNNDPLSTIGDPAGFPRVVLYELRPFQMVHTPSSVLVLYMFEKRWRTIWTDGRQLPKDPDPRWYGYSVGRWEDDTTLVVDTIGMDDRTWLDNAGNPHSDQMRVEERYHRVSMNRMELTVTIDDLKVYTAKWTPRNKLPLTLLPPTTDLMEMINNASDIQAYKREIASQTVPK